MGLWVPAEAAVYQSFADVAERSIPGVVNIRTTNYVARDPGLDLYQFFLNGSVPRSQATQALGSGVIIDRNGHILTNHHVVNGSSKIEILFAKSKKKVEASIVGTDPQTDLALLKVSGSVSELAPLDIGNSDQLRVGDIVLAIGNPFGFAHTVTSGIISAKGRVIGTGPFDNFLQTDAAIHPGNSGGPLLDVKGRVIGICTAIRKDGPGISFAIPINTAMAVVKDLIRHGKVVRPWLGVVGQNIISQDQLDSNPDPTGVYGVIVSNIVVDSPAYRGGIKIGDLVMGISGAKVHDVNELQRILASHSPSERVSVRVFRRGKGFINLSLDLDEIPKSQELPQERDIF